MRRFTTVLVGAFALFCGLAAPAFAAGVDPLAALSSPSVTAGVEALGFSI
ncbi:hypothetical protein [Streptomyces sp. URMC 123]